MKRSKVTLPQLIGLLGLLCIVVLLSPCSAKAGEALRQQKAVLGKWQDIGSTETIEFFKSGTVTYVLAGGRLEGKYEIVGMVGDVEQNADQLVGFGEIRVDFNGIGPLALPAIGKVSSSGDELVLTLSNGRAGTFKKVKSRESLRPFQGVQIDTRTGNLKIESQSSNDETTGLNLAINGKHQEAVPYFTRLIARQPQNPYHYLNRAECYRHIGDHRSALQDYNRFIDLSRNYPAKGHNIPAELALAHLRRGQQHAHLDQDNLAIQDASEAIAWYQKARNVPGTDYEKSQGAPADDVADAYQLRGDAYHNMKQDVRALEEYNQALRLNPQDAYIHCNAGLARLVLGQNAKAQQDFDRALRLDPSRKSTIEQMIRFHQQGKTIRLYP